MEDALWILLALVLGLSLGCLAAWAAVAATGLQNQYVVVAPR
jgi:hypothetical protein